MANNFVNSDLYQLNLNKAKLKAVTRTSTIFSGFAMVGLVEMSIEMNNDIDSNLTSIVLHAFTICTCLLIGVHLLALMISTCLLPQIETTLQQYNTLVPGSTVEMHESDESTKNNENIKCSDEKRMEHMDILISIINENKQELKIRPNLADLYSPSTIPSSLDPRGYLSKKQSIQYENTFKHNLPFKKFQFYIELSWLLSNGVGIFLFLVQVALVCFIKFSPIPSASNVYFSGWVIITIILVIFILFSYRFYTLLIEYKLFDKKNDIELLGCDLKKLKENLANLSVEKNFKKNFNSLTGTNLSNLLIEENNEVNCEAKLINNAENSSISLNDIMPSLKKMETKTHLNFYDCNSGPKYKTLRTHSIS